MSKFEVGDKVKLSAAGIEYSERRSKDTELADEDTNFPAGSVATVIAVKHGMLPAPPVVLKRIYGFTDEDIDATWYLLSTRDGQDTAGVPETHLEAA